MTNEEIKSECYLMYKQINDAKLKLAEIRSVCKHEETFKVKWESRPGNVFPAIICTFCGSLIKADV